MDQTREEFVVMCRTAIHDKSSGSYEELYQLLVQCFVRADKDMIGKVNLDQVDTLIEEAAALPRRYGFAPTNEQMFPNAEARKASRKKLFTQMDVEKEGYVTLDNWVNFAVEHIAGKVASNLPKDYLGGTSAEVSKEEFLAFIKKAVDKSTPEYRELYFFLLKTFMKGDANRNGEIDSVEFDKLIEDAAAAPRRFGLAPNTSEMFTTDKARYHARKVHFDSMDVNKNDGISFDEWLNFTFNHIVKKVASLK